MVAKLLVIFPNFQRKYFKYSYTLPSSTKHSLQFLLPRNVKFQNPPKHENNLGHELPGNTPAEPQHGVQLPGEVRGGRERAGPRGRGGHPPERDQDKVQEEKLGRTLSAGSELPGAESSKRCFG